MGKTGNPSWEERKPPMPCSSPANITSVLAPGTAFRCSIVQDTSLSESSSPATTKYSMASFGLSAMTSIFAMTASKAASSATPVMNMSRCLKEGAAIS